MTKSRFFSLNRASRWKPTKPATTASLVILIVSATFLIPEAMTGATTSPPRDVETLQVRDNPETGSPSFVQIAKSRPRRGDPEEVALQFFSAHQETFRLKDPARELHHVKTQRDNLGFAHVRLEQRHEGVPIFGAQLVVHMRRADDGYVVTSVNGRTYPARKVHTEPVTNAEWAAKFAVGHLGTGEVEGIPRLVLLPREGRLQLAWHVRVIATDEPARYEVFVGAIQPRVLLSFNSLTTGHGAATGSGAGVSGAPRSISTYHHTDGQFYLWDVSRPIYHPDLPFAPGMDLLDVLFQGVDATYSMGNSEDDTLLPGTLLSDADNSWTDPAGVDAHFFAGVTEGYYRTKLGRTSIDDGSVVPGGMSIVSSVHFGTDFCNAFWDGRQMVYGNGGECSGDGFPDFRALSGALDVVGHELTHGVTQFTADLIYLNQSGALNESYSDYFGNAIENNHFERTDGRIGEDICPPASEFCTAAGGTALRDMNNGRTMTGYDFLPEAEDSGGVHTNSDIYNDTAWNIRDAFGTASGQAGRDLADKIMYRALAVYMFPSAIFADGREAMLQAARDLGATAAQIQTITDEFDAHQIGWGFDNTYVPSGFGVSVQSGAQFGAHFDGTRIAWIDDADLLAHVMDTSTGTELTFGEGLVVDVDISGSRLVWSELDLDTFFFKVMTATLPDGTPTLVSTVDPGLDHMGARIDGSVVVWMTFDGSDFDTFWDDLTTPAGPDLLAGEIGSDELSPVVGHDGTTPWAAWEDYSFGDRDIFTRSLPNGIADDRTPTIATQIRPEISGRNVIYLEDSDGNSTTELLNVVDVEAGNPSTIKSTATDLGGFGPAAIDGTTVVYSDLSTTGNRAYDLYTNNLTGTAEAAVSTARGWQTFPSISGSRIVWEDTQLGDTDVFSNLAVETIAPTVTGRAPEGSVVPVPNEVSATFSEAMDARSLNGASFTVRRQGSTSDTPGNVSYDFDTRTATFSSFVPLQMGTTYIATLSAAARDTRGNQIASPVSWSFSTAAPAPAGGAYFGFDIARGVVLLQDGTGGYVLDGWGGVHPFGGAPAVNGLPYFPSHDIARGLVLLPDSTGGYVLDGFGARHPFGVGANPPAPATNGGPYFAGFDIARGIVLNSAATGGYVLDGFGARHPFGVGANPPAPATNGGPYFAGFDIARGIVLNSAATGGYVLDGFGGRHRFAVADYPSPQPMNSGPYFSGFDIAKGVVLVGGGGLLLDGFGGLHTFGP